MNLESQHGMMFRILEWYLLLYKHYLNITDEILLDSMVSTFLLH